ncbi:type III secretion system export apparatus subunit SctT [Burkholderia sp. Bp8986]|uniref:type III secretion system export apparatus subunit SctT n=1 Tax=Burkholderia sp. Bp8986 TaxID=2184550 RepID=UPI000F58F99F|nr:type III secretion system export apparatus subunit SctT [Burkholderia sp. Bp8986]RQS43254.1 EscT/YscT/HrcT family type III secretion system export apparatus protein [Burkholderia sp. Bp8986]
MLSYFDFSVAIFLSFLRPLGVFLILPVFNSSNLGGATIRNALCLVLALPIAPGFVASNILDSLTVFEFISICIEEILLGLLYGVVASIPFWAIDGAGYLIDTIGGTEVSSLFNPSLGTQSSLLGNFFSKALILLFFTSGGWHALSGALYQSYRDIPMGSILNLTAPTLVAFINLAKMPLQLAVRFALPAILVMLVIDISFGLINRAVHQMDVFFLAMPVKSVASALIISVTLAFGFQLYIDQFIRLGSVIKQISLLMR